MDKNQNPAGSVDLLHGPIMKNLLIFMLPVFISIIFQQFYNVADTAFVGNYLGESALAAVGSVSSVIEFLVFFSQSLGVGLSIVAGREFGKGDNEIFEDEADVFLICPTVDTKDENNMSMTDEKNRKHFLGALNMERGIYEDNARLFAPYYRQASLKAWTLDEEEREECLALA